MAKDKIAKAFLAITKDKFTIDTIADMIATKHLAEGDIVRLNGYYSAGDGANHIRIISKTNDGSGILLANGLYANIVHEGEVNVSWFGARGDGLTDDTNAIKKILNNSSVHSFFGCNKTYKMDKLTLASANSGMKIKDITILPTSNVGIDVVEENVHSIQLENVSILFSENRKENIGIEFSAETNKSHGAYKWVCNNVFIRNVGIGINIKKTGRSYSVWGMYFFNLKIDNISISAIDLRSSPSIGQPNNSFNKVAITNNHSIRDDVSYAIAIEGEAYFNDLNIEYWRNSLFHVPAGNFLSIKNIHIESHKSTQDYLKIFDLNNIICNIEGMSFQTTLTKNWAFLFSGANSRIMLSDINSFTYSDSLDGTLLSILSTGNVYSILGDIPINESNILLNQIYVDIHTDYVLKLDRKSNVSKYTKDNSTERIVGQVFDDRTCRIKYKNDKIVLLDKEYVTSKPYTSTEISKQNKLYIGSLGNYYESISDGDSNINPIWIEKTIDMVGDLTERDNLTAIREGQKFYDRDSKKLYIYSTGLWKELTITTAIQQLDTPYHATNMQKLGILDSYHNYLTELHEYEKSQNVPEGVMNLNVIQPPVIPKEIEEYAKEYNLL
ncbi:MAG: hypothetical protein ACRCYT_09430 [Cetobacterium sp.]